jgi:hypothetical protein
MGNLIVCQNGVNHRVKMVRDNMGLCGATCANVLRVFICYPKIAPVAQGIEQRISNRRFFKSGGQYYSVKLAG